MRNPDGTPYRAAGSNRQFDPVNNNREYCLFNLWDEEAIEIGGSPILYYEVFINKGSIDPLYWEARDKIYSNIPVELFCTYEPVASENYQGAFGFDAPTDMVFEFNYRAVLQKLAHPPRVGARLFTPHKSENWVVIQRNLGEFKMWGELRLQLICQRWQETATTGEGKVSQKKTDFKLNG